MNINELKCQIVLLNTFVKSVFPEKSFFTLNEFCNFKDFCRLSETNEVGGTKLTMECRHHYETSPS